MSLRRCEKLIAPRILKRICAAAVLADELFAKLFVMTAARSLATLLASSLSVLRECGHETLRALCIFARIRLALGHFSVHRRHRIDGLFGRNRARSVRAPDSARNRAPFARSGASARVRRANDFSHARGAVLLACLYAHLCD